MSHSFKSPCDEAVLQSRPTTVESRPDTEAWVLVATILGSSMAFIDSSAVNVALPVIQRELNATATDMQWVIEAYALFLSALILVGGSLGDHFGRRRIFALGISIFILASIWCGLAPSISQLILARAIQGIGGALLVPGSLAIISTSFSEERRGKAIGTWSGFTSVTSVIGPVLGGWLIQTASWRWVFFLNAPLALIILGVVFWRVPESKDTHITGRLDVWGTLLATFGLGGIVFGLIEAGNRGLGDSFVLTALLSGLIMLGVFLLLEARSKNPMVPLSLFHSSDFSGTNALTLLLYAALGAAIYFLPFNLIQIQGYSAAEAGAALVPFAFTMFLLSRWTGGLVRQFGAKLPLVVGPTITAIGFILFALTGVGGSYWFTFFPAVLFMSFGMTVTVAPLTTTVMGAVDQDEVGAASGINNAISRTASLLAIAIFGIVMANVFNANLADRLTALQLQPQIYQQIINQRSKLAGIGIPQTVSGQTRTAIKQAIDAAFISGFHTIMFMSAGLALISAGIALFMIGNHGKQRKPSSSPAMAGEE